MQCPNGAWNTTDNVTKLKLEIHIPANPNNRNCKFRAHSFDLQLWISELPQVEGSPNAWIRASYCTATAMRPTSKCGACAFTPGVRLSCASDYVFEHASKYVILIESRNNQFNTIQWETSSMSSRQNHHANTPIHHYLKTLALSQNLPFLRLKR